MTDLPAEILSKIITYLPHDGKLVQAMLVCRRFRNIIEPIFYRSIALQSLPPRHRTGHTDAAANLLRTLCSRPELARYVTTVSSGRGTLYDQAYADFTRLIGLFPRLQVLDLTPEVTDLDLTHLHLKTLLLLFPDSMFYDEGEDPMDIVVRHFWMPTLRTLQIENISVEGQLDHLFPLERYQTSPIIDLRLLIVFCAYQTHGILPQILLSVKSLRRFTVEFSSSIDIEVDDLHEHLSLEVITSALLPHVLTLEQIIIVIGSSLDVSRALPKRGFMCFAALRRLVISEAFLQYCEGSKTQLALPLQLEELQLQYIVRPYWYKDPNLERLPVLARMVQASLRALKLVVWWNEVPRWGFEDSTPYIMTPDMETLAHTFHQVGVLFRRVDQPYLKDTPLGQNMFRYY